MLSGARLVSSLNRSLPGRLLTLSRSKRLFSSATGWKRQSNRWRTLIGGSCLIASAGGVTFAKSRIAQDADEVVPMDEVAKHNKPDDAWIVIDGKVYDVTSWIAWHPGGSKILEAHAGKDVSREWHSLKHSQTAKTLMSGLHIADVSPYSPPPLSPLQAEEETSKGKDKIVIVGAGICGVAAAYFLSQDKRYDITVIDKSHIVGGTPMPYTLHKSHIVGGTALASSAILFLGGLVEKEDLSTQQVPLVQWSGQWQFELMRQMQREWEDIDMVERGTMGVIQTEEQLAYLQRHLAPGGRMHGKMDFLSRDEALALEPALSPHIKGATLVPQGATFDPFSVCNALCTRACDNGTRLAMGHHVTAVRASKEGEKGGRRWVVECVSMDSGATEHVTADHVLVCNGWQSNTVLREAGITVPVTGVRGQMFATHHPDLTLKHNIFSWEAPHFWATHPQLGHQHTLDPEDGHRVTRHLYGLQISNGTLKFGGDRLREAEEGVREEAQGQQLGADQRGVHEAGIAETVRHVTELFPALKDCEVVGSWSGVMAFVRDQKPLLGQLQPGLWVLTGAPFTKGAAYAKLLAEFVAGDPAHAHFQAEVSPLRFKKETAPHTPLTADANNNAAPKTAQSADADAKSAAPKAEPGTTAPQMRYVGEGHGTARA